MTSTWFAVVGLIVIGIIVVGFMWLVVPGLLLEGDADDRDD